MAARTFRVAFEDEVLGGIGSGQRRCRNRQSAYHGAKTKYLSHKSHFDFPFNPFPLAKVQRKLSVFSLPRLLKHYESHGES